MRIVFPAICISDLIETKSEHNCFSNHVCERVFAFVNINPNLQYGPTQIDADKNVMLIT